MSLRFTNAAILGLLALLTLTGVYGIVWTLNGWMFDAHRAAGWALIALIPWKAAISLRSLRRGLDRRFDRSLVVIVSVALAAATLLVVGLGLTWAWRLGPAALWLGQSAVSWHWMLALALIPPLALHAWRRWPRPKRSDFLSRRGALKLLGLGAAGMLGWRAAETLAGARALEESPRRFTGSRESGSFSGNGFPVTNGLGEGKTVLDAQAWTLAFTGGVRRTLRLSYAEILSLSTTERVATIDCTTGWYSAQTWRGIPLMAVLDHAGLPPAVEAVRLRAVSGYTADFTLDEARDILLATHVGGQALDHWHGFPLRAVVPARRGWFWVKWLTEVEALAGPRAQVPLLSAPRAFAPDPHALSRFGAGVVS